ncbi:hypothetical protein PHAVU_010G066778 [Phaseolus vulgaris]
MMGSFSSSPSSPSSSSPSTSSTPQEHPQNNLNQHKLSHVLKYHNQTKHNFNHFARGPHGLDWANQPNPFRRYLSSPLISLLHPQPPYLPPLYHSLFLSLPLPTPFPNPPFPSSSSTPSPSPPGKPPASPLGPSGLTPVAAICIPLKPTSLPHHTLYL